MRRCWQCVSLRYADCDLQVKLGMEKERSDSIRFRLMADYWMYTYVTGQGPVCADHWAGLDVPLLSIPRAILQQLLQPLARMPSYHVRYHIA